jgi:CRP-like cAMP-binding protein
MVALENNLHKISTLSPAAMQAFLSKWEERRVPKDQFLLKKDEVNNHLFFIQKGIARIFYHKDKKEITEWIAMDETFFFSIISFFERTPSRLMIQTVEPSFIYGIHHDALMELCDQHHEIERLFRKMLTHSLTLSQIRVDALQFETAKQRYKKLLEETPTIVQRVALSHIASFLGITQETLSRIRAVI